MIQSFATPARDDLSRGLARICDEGKTSAAEKVDAIHAIAARAGGARHGRYTLALTQVLLPLHGTFVNRAMQFVSELIPRTSIPVEELVDEAQGFLMSRVDDFYAHIDRALRTCGSSNSGDCSRLPFVRQIEYAAKDIRVGFVNEKDIAVQTSSTIQSKALSALRVIYERTHAHEAPVFMEEINEELGITLDEARSAWRYLRDRNLIETFSIPYTARVNANGIDAIETARLHPNQPTAGFPSVTYNNVTVFDSGTGSQINVGSVGATQVSLSNPASVPPALLEGVRQLVDQTLRALPTSHMSEELQRKATTALNDLRGAANEPTPEIGSLRTGLESLKRIMEHATGHMLAVGTLAGIAYLLSLT